MLRSPGGGTDAFILGADSSDTQVLFNDSSTIAGDAGLTYNKTTDILTVGGLILSNNGAASTPAGRGTGTWFSGGSATTTKPYVLIEPSGTTSTGWSTSGTGLGINAASGFAGSLIDAQVSGTSRAKITAAGFLTLNTSSDATHIFAGGGFTATLQADALQLGITGTVQMRLQGGTEIRIQPDNVIGFSSSGVSTLDLMFGRNAAATLRLGAADAASPVAQTLTVQGVVAGTSNTAGALWTFKDSVGTGTGASGGYAWQTAAAGGSGTSQNTQTTKMTLAASGAFGLVEGATIFNATGIPAGGTAGSGYKFSSTSNFGVFFGSGAPTLSAAKGSLYLRSDGTGTGDRAYINTDGGTTWTALTTAA